MRNLIAFVCIFVVAAALFSCGGDNAVTAEVVVALALTEVTAVAQYLLAVYIGVPESLIHIVPDKSTLIVRILSDQIPIFL